MIAIGTVMVAVVVIDNWPQTYKVGNHYLVKLSGLDVSNPDATYTVGGILDMLKEPILYLGLALGVAGAVVLKGDSNEAM